MWSLVGSKTGGLYLLPPRGLASLRRSLSASSPGLCRMGEAVWFHGASPTLRLVTEAGKNRQKDGVITFTGELIVRAHWPPWEATECLCAPVGQIIRVLNRAEKEEIEDEFIGEWPPHCLLRASFRGADAYLPGWFLELSLGKSYPTFFPGVPVSPALPHHCSYYRVGTFAFLLSLRHVPYTLCLSLLFMTQCPAPHPASMALSWAAVLLRGGGSEDFT